MRSLEPGAISLSGWTILAQSSVVLWEVQEEPKDEGTVAQQPNACLFQKAGPAALPH